MYCILQDCTNKSEYEILNKIFTEFEKELKQTYNTRNFDLAILKFVQNYSYGDNLTFSDNIKALISEYKKQDFYSKSWLRVSEVKKHPEYLALKESLEQYDGDHSIKGHIVTIEDEDEGLEKSFVDEEKIDNILLNPYGDLFKCLEANAKSMDKAFEDLKFAPEISTFITNAVLSFLIEEENLITDATTISTFLFLYVEKAINKL